MRRRSDSNFNWSKVWIEFKLLTEHWTWRPLTLLTRKQKSKLDSNHKEWVFATNSKFYHHYIKDRIWIIRNLLYRTRFTQLRIFKLSYNLNVVLSNSLIKRWSKSVQRFMSYARSKQTNTPNIDYYFIYMKTRKLWKMKTTLWIKLWLYKWSNEHETQQLCSLNRPLFLNKWFK